MSDNKWPKLITRREYLKLLGLLGTGTLLNACGGGAAPSAEQPAAVEPTATPVEAAAATREVEVVIPTDTPAPAPTEVPLWSDAIQLRQQVHWSGDRFNDFKKLCDEWNLGPGTDANIYIHTERHGA